jgi:hypothetical protein
VESLLNFCWLLLVLPGFYLWRSRTRYATAWRVAVALGCLFFLLFPVISATDDLLALGRDMEESPCGKSGGMYKSQVAGSPALLPNSTHLLGPVRSPCGHILEVATPVPQKVLAFISPSRAPPFFPL